MEANLGGIPRYFTAERRRLATGLLLTALLAGMVLRGPLLNASLWVDELHTSWVVADGWGEIPQRAAAGNYSPVYFWLVKLAITLGGHAEWTLRGPSLLAGLGLILVLGTMAWRMFRSPWAVGIAAGLTAIDQACVEFSVEARPYALVQLMWALHLAALWELCQRQREAVALWRWRALFVVTGWAAFWLHFTGGLLVVCDAAILAVWWAANARTRSQGPARLADLAVVALGFLPAWPLLTEISGRSALWSAFIPQWSPWEAVQRWPLGIYLLVPAAMAVAGAWGHRRGRLLGDFSSGTILAGAWFLVLPFFAWVTTATDLARLFHIRYLAAALPGGALWAAGSVSRWRSDWIAAALAAMLLLLSAYAGTTPGPSGASLLVYEGVWVRRGHEDWRAAADYLRDRAEAGDLVLLDAGLIECDREHAVGQGRDYCRLPLRGLYRLPPDVEAIPLTRFGQFASAKDRSRAITAGSVWALIRGARQNTQPDLRRLERQLAAAGATTEIAAAPELRGITLVRLRIEPTAQ